MVLWTPGFDDVKVIGNTGIVGAANPGTSLPVSGTTLNYGTVTEVISAANNTQDSWGIEVVLIETCASAVAPECSVDILIGGATDDVLISSLLAGGAYAGSERRYFFPLHVPGGVRIAARIAHVSTVRTPRIFINLHGGSPPPFRVGRKVTTYGTKINNARGQAVTPSASGAAASVTQMTASTSEDHFYFLPGFQIAVDTSVNLRNINLGIGVGAATEERIGTWWLRTDAAEHQSMHPTMGAWRHVPAGSRLTLLASNSGTNDSDHDGHVYAVS
jgi:hypothetical protein